MKDCYELKGPSRKNPYASRMRRGYSIVIDCGLEADDDDERLELARQAEEDPDTADVMPIEDFARQLGVPLP